MSEEKNYQRFGGQLKKIRLEAKKTLTDVSGAVELPEDKLSKIEKGTLRPREDLIFLLANYFKLSKPQTQQLRHLAGYREKRRKTPSQANQSPADLKMHLEDFIGRHLADSAGLLLTFTEPMQDKALYTNKTDVNISHNGVIIQFSQSTFMEKGHISMPVAKVGMSLEHAQQFSKILIQALKKIEKSGHVGE